MTVGALVVMPESRETGAAPLGYGEALDIPTAKSGEAPAAWKLWAAGIEHTKLRILSISLPCVITRVAHTGMARGVGHGTVQVQCGTKSGRSKYAV